MIHPLDPAWFKKAVEHQARLTMPPGALGRLLELGQQLCAVQETLRPVTEPAAVLVMAADHGIAAEGVSAFPQEVTGQMVANFLAGGAAINVLARRSGARILVVDMGTKARRGRQPSENLAASPIRQGPPGADAPGSPELVDHRIAPGTANFLHGPAMTRQQAEEALAAGRRVVAERLSDVRVLALGEMGIGNTTSASALTAVLTGKPAREVTGRGTGLDDAALRHKIHVIEEAVKRHFPGEPGALAPGAINPLDALTAVGGFEVAGLAGAALEAASRRMVVVLDGFISGVAGLIAARIDPNLKGYLVAAHRSVEAGHRAVLEALDKNPLFDLGLRLGEGSGAALALGVIHAAADIMREMATFESAGVSTE